MRVSSLLLLGVLGALLVGPEVGHAAEAKQGKQGKQEKQSSSSKKDPNAPRFYKIELTLPKELAFFEHPMSLRADAQVAFPFAREDLAPRVQARYVSSHYLDVQLIHLSYSKPLTVEGFLEPKLLAERQVSVLAKRAKRFGAPGQIYQLRQDFPGKVYRKWVAVFGNKTQTEILVAVYAQRLESTFIPQLMQNTIEMATLGKEDE